MTHRKSAVVQLLFEPSIQKQQLEHKEPGPNYDGSISKIKGVPVISSVVSVNKIHNSAEADAIEEI
jgi:hypothetical protein